MLLDSIEARRLRPPDRYRQIGCNHMSRLYHRCQHIIDENEGPGTCGRALADFTYFARNPRRRHSDRHSPSGARRPIP